MTTHPIVQIRNLRVAFRTGRGENEVLHGIDMVVNKGEILGVIGESGSGKTMTGMSLLRLLPDNAKVTADEMRFDGVDLPPMSEGQFAGLRGVQLAMIFQDPVGSFNPAKTIGWHFDQILKQAGVANDGRQRGITLLEEVGVKRATEVIDLYPHQLSGGMLQRALIALVIALRPALIVADEPTTNLDKVVEAQILELFLDMRNRLKAAMIFVTHDMAVAASLCDRIAVMNAGEIVETGEAKAVFTDPQHPYTKKLIDTALELSNSRAKTVVSGTESAAASKGEAEPLFKVRDLSVTFPGSRTRAAFKALDDISFDIQPGEILGLVGESGSGKTTLGRTLLRLYTPSGGEIVYRGRDITHLPERALRGMRRQLQMVFQDPGGSFNPRTTMGASLAEALVMVGCPRVDIPKRSIALLERVGLTAAHADRYVHQLSGGQLQRVAVARAIALEPSMIVADEAVSKLDVSVRAGVLDLFKDIQAETGMAMVFITHDLDAARFMCDRMAVLLHGKLLEIGPTEQIFAAPSHEYTRTLLASQGALSRAVGARLQ
ncbi:ABC transporter ATP-binding protein [Neorhizobium sp. NCHU2750]|uniref:dipeptide ABC transporter ATP-binding protein n=1 Tax=Neorhizobium sp. NCHU2750 TaxID=1825976 RepID=UPI000E70D67B|nr:peptide/nickel ABC transporter ATP-binding protein [Neorhizobium sp. NCHU2750]